MPRHLLAHIDVWSVARTVFPLAWLVSAALLFLIYLLAGSLLMDFASEYYDMPAGARSVGIIASLLGSIITGFIYTIFATIFSVTAAAGYNLLVQWGGGVAFSSRPLAEPESQQRGEVFGVGEASLGQGNIERTEGNHPESGGVGETEDR